MKSNSSQALFPIRADTASSKHKRNPGLFWTLKDLHAELFKLYVGPDASFTSLTCAQCALLAYNPSECGSCYRLTCIDCRESTRHNGNCNSCSGKLGKAGQVHFLAKQILNNAVFKCPYGCQLNAIVMGDLQEHIQQNCPAALQDCPNRCGENLHVAMMDEHRESCTHEPVTCDRCNEVTVPRHQIQHHKNEACFAKVICIKCKCEYPRRDSHGLEDCIVGLARKIEQLEKDKVDRDSLIQLLLKKVDKKANDQLLHLLVNDYDAAKASLNKQFGSIRIKPKPASGRPQEDQDVAAQHQQPEENLSQKSAAAQHEVQYRNVSPLSVKNTIEGAQKHQLMHQIQEESKVNRVAQSTQILASQELSRQTESQAKTQMRPKLSKENLASIRQSATPRSFAAPISARSSHAVSQLGTLRKLSICGNDTKKGLFQFPEDLESLISRRTAVKMSKRLLHRITCGIYDAIGSIQLHFSDGAETQQFGCDSQGQHLKCSLEVPDDELINGVRIRHNSSRSAIQNITFDTEEGTEIEFNGKMNDGEWSNFQLESGELIVGCYGSCWSEKEPELVALGFVVWTPQLPK